MKSWTAPPITPLPASGIAPRLHDTRTDSLQTVEPITPGTGRLYVCGITPYDSTHMGHAATYHAADLMVRTMLDTGWSVETAENITDVDDPLFERAERDGIEWHDLAAREVEKFAGDMEALRILPPDTFESVSEAMGPITETVETLVKRGRAYRVPTDDAEGDDWYLDARADGALGDVSGYTPEQMMEVFADRGGDPDRAGKRDPFDPKVWSAAREGEPSWPSEILGAGRPGWHVECVRIADDALGLPFDIQAGGSDLIFPHHDLSNVHAAALGQPFATIYTHVGMVGYEGEKMSKSLGNLVFVSVLVEQGVDPRAIRLVLADHHYREDWEWTDDQLADNQARLERYLAAAESGRADADAVEELRVALRDDLDTPRALRVLDAWADAALGSEGGGATGASGSAGQAAPDASDERPSDVAAACDALLGINLR